MAAFGSRTMIASSSSGCIGGFHQSCRFSQSSSPRHHPARDARALAQGRLSLLLALEVAPSERRPQIEAELGGVIRRISMENPLWGALRVHGELLKLGFAVAQSSVAKYMVKRRGPPGQGWRTFLHNHAPEIAAMDLFVVPIVGFDLLNAFVIVRLDRRDLVWINVTINPTAEWVARQLTEAFPWNEAPGYMIRDAIGFTAPSSHADCVPWISGTSLPHQLRPGRTALPNG